MSTRRVAIRLCPATLAAIPIRGEIIARTFRIRAAIHRAEAADDTLRANAARLTLMTLGQLLARLTEALTHHRDLHPYETESMAELAEIRQALGIENAPMSRSGLPAPQPADISTGGIEA